MSLRWQVALVVLLVTAGTVGGVGLAVVRALDAWTLDVVDRQLAERTQRLRAALSHEPGELELDDDDAPDGWYRVEREGGGVLASSPRWPELGPAVDGAVTVPRAGQSPVRARAEAWRPSPTEASLWLRVAAPLEAELLLADRVRGGVLGLSLVGVLVAALAAWLLARRLLAPFDRLSRQVDALEPSAVEQRVDEAGLGPELRRVASAFNGLLARVAGVLAAQRGFSARASHALKTPVAALRTTAEVALRHERSAADYRAALEDVLATAKDAARLADGLLALQRADASAHGEALQPVPVAPLLRRAERLFDARAREAGVTLAVTAPEGLACLAHPLALDECLDAVLDNAVRYTPRGGRVLLEARPAPGGVVLEVRDDGPGFAPDEQPQVFERFFRGAAAASTSGSGLGLALVKALVEAQGGQVTAGRAPEGGARVSLHLRSSGAA